MSGVGAVLVLLASCSSDAATAPVTVGGDTPESTEAAPASTAAASTGVQPEGFSTVRARVTSADGDVCEVCLWLADTDEERGRGLMGVTDLGDAVGMAFTWDAPSSSRFVMIDTPTPLSIAWFAGDGSFISDADMEPCVDVAPATCERYSAAGDYTLAVETFVGELDTVGIGPGARLELLAGTEAPDCSLGP